jgi:cyclopropane-fatty-acyl-phospholipid synthase
MPIIETRQEHSSPECYAVEVHSGESYVCGEGDPAFALSVANEAQLQRILKGDDYSAARAFIHGEFDIEGDICAAVRLKQANSRSHVFPGPAALAARFAPCRIETWFQSRKRAADNIRFHYDISNEFYQNFLDSRMAYSAAYFEDPAWTLEQAQEARFNRICRLLELHPGERFLDVGCGWGGLLIHAATRYKVRATGCTLSRNQYQFAASAIARGGLAGRASVMEADYRDLSGQFDKIASIGMFEHVGRRRLGKYFRTIYKLLKDGGLFLNSGITRPRRVGDDSQTWFLLRKVFPGGELADLSDVIHAMEAAGLSLIQAQNLRVHYAETCRRWVDRLQRYQNSCLNLVGQETYRTWLLYLAAAAVSFDTGQTDVFSILTKKGKR